MSTPTLGQALGHRLRELREQAGASQEDVARAARDSGLTWTRAHIAGIEAGRHEFALGEALILPSIIRTALGMRVRLGDLLASLPTVRFVPGAVAEGHSLTVLLTATPHSDALEGVVRPVPVETRTDAFLKRVRAFLPKADDVTILELIQETKAEEVRAMADRLMVQTFPVALACRSLYGRTLAEERDARVAAQGKLDAPRRTVQAVRGHVTRSMLEEIASVVKRWEEEK